MGQRLAVNGGVQTNGSAALGTGFGGGAVLSFETPITRMYFGDGTGYSFAFSKRASSTTTDLMTITDSGNLGIGTSSPSYKLHVRGTDATAGDSGSSGSTGGGVNSGISMSPEGVATANSVNANAIGAIGSMALGPIGSVVGKSIANVANFNAAQDAMNVNVAVSDTTAAANNVGVTTAAATAAVAASASALGRGNVKARRRRYQSKRLENVRGDASRHPPFPTGERADRLARRLGCYGCLRGIALLPEHAEYRACERCKSPDYRRHELPRIIALPGCELQLLSGLQSNILFIGVIANRSGLRSRLPYGRLRRNFRLRYRRARYRRECCKRCGRCSVAGRRYSFVGYEKSG